MKKYFLTNIKYWKKFGFFYGYPKREKIIFSE